MPSRSRNSLRQARRRWPGGFGAAFAGFRELWREGNFRFHIITAVALAFAGVFLRVSVQDWLWLGLGVALVLTTEALNTAIERLCDAVHPHVHPLIKASKDVGAAAVLLSALFAGAVGFLVLGPYVLDRLRELVP